MDKNRSVGSKIFRGTMTIVIVGILAKITAFITETILAAHLGTTYKSDAYYMISSVKDVFYPMLSIGIWKVFLPIYKSHISKGEKATAYALTNKSITFFTAISMIVVVFLLLFAPVVVSIVAPGFVGETRELCIRLVRISAPMYILIIASAIYASILQCHEKFLGSQIREVASHIPTIIAAVFLYKRFDIYSMAVALVAGGGLRLLIELPFVDWGYKYKPDFGFKTQEFSLMLKRLPSALISAGVAQLNALIDKAMASTLPVGTISALNYGHKLLNVFSGMLSSAIAAAMYPQMIELISLGKKDELSELTIKIINIFCALMFPITIACVLFRTELVAAVFQRGAFDTSSTLITANVFALYCIGIFFLACNTVISNIFYGHGNTQTAMYISVANLLINVALNFILIHFWGVNGLALATSLSAVITFFIRIIATRKYIDLRQIPMIINGIKVLFASAAACIIPRTIFWLYPINKYMILVISALMGGAIYYVLIRVFNVEEVDYLVKIIKRKMRSN